MKVNERGSTSQVWGEGGRGVGGPNGRHADVRRGVARCVQRTACANRVVGQGVIRGNAYTYCLNNGQTGRPTVSVGAVAAGRTCATRQPRHVWVGREEVGGSSVCVQPVNACK